MLKVFNFSLYLHQSLFSVDYLSFQVDHLLVFQDPLPHFFLLYFITACVRNLSPLLNPPQATIFFRTTFIRSLRIPVLLLPLCFIHLLNLQWIWQLLNLHLCNPLFEDLLQTVYCNVVTPTILKHQENLQSSQILNQTVCFFKFERWEEEGWIRFLQYLIVFLEIVSDGTVRRHLESWVWLGHLLN
jgi:hypothetical protein